MSNKPSLTELRKLAQKQIKSEERFQPNDFQERVKARFWRRMEEQSHRLDQETVFASADLLTELAGTDRILKWSESPQFSNWFLDEDYTKDTIMSLQNKAIYTIKDILEDDSTYKSDKLKAARTLLELGEQFPNKKEIRFIDDTLNQMSMSEVDRETLKLDKQLERAKLEE